MASTGSLTATEVVTMLLQAVERHRDGADPNGDFTLLCLKLIKG